jgi:VIT1/CCC1 family predicted Fe2+/Mn2+ transporter
MAGSSTNEDARGWYSRFVERLDPGERLGELLFGLIMVLTFTLGAGIELGDREEGRELLVAALGCNTAWGIIDAVLYLIGRLSERGRLHRLVSAIQAAPAAEAARALVSRELDDRLPALVAPQMRAALDAHVLERVRELEPGRNRVTGDDLLAGLAVFWLVFLTALPAAAPFLLIQDPQLAMRTSNAVLIALLFYVGWRWAGFTGAGRWRTALVVSLLGVALVLVAIALGG